MLSYSRVELELARFIIELFVIFLIKRAACILLSILILSACLFFTFGDTDKLGGRDMLSSGQRLHIVTFAAIARRL